MLVSKKERHSIDLVKEQMATLYKNSQNADLTYVSPPRKVMAPKSKSVEGPCLPFLEIFRYFSWKRSRMGYGIIDESPGHGDLPTRIGD